jgi:hypothetical protein
MDRLNTRRKDPAQAYTAVNFNFEYSNYDKKDKFKSRRIVSGKQDLKLKNNKISTNKYNFVTFFPLNLFEQFTKVANVYFLVRVFEFPERFLDYRYYAIGSRHFSQ